MEYFKFYKESVPLKMQRFCDKAFLQVGTADSSAGKYIENWGSENFLEYLPEHDGPVKDAIANGFLIPPVVSLKVKDLLESRLGLNKDREDVQFLPITVRKHGDPDGPSETYYFMNVIRFVEGAVDLEKSVRGFDDSIMFPALIAERVAPYDVFKVPERWMCMYVSGRVRDLLLKECDMYAKFDPVKVV